MIQELRMIFRIVFSVFDAGYRAIVSYCFYVIPESVIEFDKTSKLCTKNTEDLGIFGAILVTQ